MTGESAGRARLIAIVADMQAASDAADEANGTSDYMARMVALALIARHFLREGAAEALAGQDGVGLIAAERQRQIEREGWTPAHDDTHTYGELAGAAMAYIANRDVTTTNEPPLGWPWEASWWKPSADPIRNLAKAGALIAAEIDRLQRGQENSSEQRRTDEATKHRTRVSEGSRSVDGLEASARGDDAQERDGRGIDGALRPTLGGGEGSRPQHGAGGVFSHRESDIALAGQEEAPQQPTIADMLQRVMPAPRYSREEFERDQMGETGERLAARAKAKEDAPAPPRYHEESLALRILQEQKDLEAHTRAVTDVDRLTQIRDSVLKEPQP